MKLVIQIEELAGSLGKVQGIVERKTSNDILGNVKISAKNGSLILHTTDLDLDITETINAEVSEEGETTVTAHKFLEILRKLPPKDKITLSLENDILNISSKDFKGKFPTLPASEFPVSNNNVYDTNFSLKAKDLILLLEKTRIAVSMDESRYFLTGVYLHINNSFLRAVATDGHRLSLVEIPAPAESLQMPNIIIPKKAVDNIYKLLESLKEDEEIKLSISPNKACFTTSSASLNTKLIDGTFPDYIKVIPTGAKFFIKTNAEEFKKSVDRVSIFADEKIRNIKLNIQNSSMTLSANKDISGETSVALNEPSGEIQISFNSRYLMDILNLISDKNITMELTSPNAPALIKSSDKENEFFVIMPMRI